MIAQAMGAYGEKGLWIPENSPAAQRSLEGLKGRAACRGWTPSSFNYQKFDTPISKDERSLSSVHRHANRFRLLIAFFS